MAGSNSIQYIDDVSEPFANSHQALRCGGIRCTDSLIIGPIFRLGHFLLSLQWIPKT